MTCTPSAGCSWSPTATRSGRSVKYLEGISDDDIVGLEIPTGVPLVWFRRPDDHRTTHLGDPEAIPAVTRGAPSRRLTAEAGRPAEADVPARGALQSASLPRSPVRTRTTVSTGTTHTLPSPIFPVAAVRTMASTTSSACGVVHEHLDPELGDEVHLVLRSPVHLGVAPLAAEALRLGERHALDPHGLQGLLHVVELEGLEDRHDQLHCRVSLSSLDEVSYGTVHRVAAMDPALPVG